MKLKAFGFQVPKELNYTPEPTIVDEERIKYIKELKHKREIKTVISKNKTYYRRK